MNKPPKTSQGKRKYNERPPMTAGEFYSKVMDSEAARTSFGKLILGDEKSSPQYSIKVYNDTSVRNG